jgi:hypothetical protein
MNQHSYPHWHDLAERWLMRWPVELVDAVDEAAAKAGLTRAEFVRLTMADRVGLEVQR